MIAPRFSVAVAVLIVGWPASVEAATAAAALPLGPQASSVSLNPQRDKGPSPFVPRTFEYRLISVLDWDSEMRVSVSQLVGTGADLYLRRGAPPTLSQWDARSATNGTSDELIVINGMTAAPIESGIWYAGILKPAGTVFSFDVAKVPTVSERPGMGAIPYDGGTTFRVWAPSATEVHVAGAFNGWNGTSAPLANEGNGHWSLDVRDVGDGDSYKFVFNTGTTINWRIDPRAAKVTNSVGDSVVVDHDLFPWTGTFQAPTWNDVVLYEMHVGTFNDTPGGAPGTFTTALARLDLLSDLGVNMIELMPIAEFGGDYSWGYNPAHLFAPETAYGGVDELKTFVQAAHDRGMGVMLDVLYNHFGPTDIPHWQFDGFSPGRTGGNYFYDDFRAQTPWGDTRPDYARAEVRQYIRDNALYWLNEYRMDGLRFDATAYIRIGPAGDLPDGWSVMQWANDAVDLTQPWKLITAEDLRNNEWITKDTGAGGAGFDAQWDAQFVHPIRAAIIDSSDASRNMFSVRDAIAARYNGDAFERVIYTESHDEVANGRSRVPEEIWPGNASSWYSKKRSTLGAAITLTSPGIPMLFQGQEILEDEWFRDTDPVDWAKLTTFGGIRSLYKDLIALRRNFDGATRGLMGQNLNVHHLNNGSKVIGYHRWDQGGAGDDVVVLANFSNTTFPSYRIGVPNAGFWNLRFNSDWDGYDQAFGNHPSTGVSADPIPYDGMAYSIDLTIAPYTALILSQ